MDSDVIILGAGVAGLTAAVQLARAGLRVVLVEARPRLGGRLFTRHDPSTNAAIELGAEFIHGHPPEIFDLARKHHISTVEVSGTPWCFDTRLHPCEFFSEIDDLLDKMDARAPDQSFLDFLAQHPEARPATRARALAYVTGFNAADAGMVSVHWLVQGLRADAEIDGERAFRLRGGYEKLVETARKELAGFGVTTLLSTVAESVRWQPTAVEITANNPKESFILTAPRLLITVPLAVLQARPGEAGALRFVPELPPEKREALTQLVMGRVTRITLCFRQRFWEHLKPPSGGPKTLADMSFLFSPDDRFPTWWTTMPEKLPILTAWSASHCTDQLSGLSASAVAEKALETLSRLLPLSQTELESQISAAYTHDWQSDPFSRGAYSYVKVGGTGAPRQLGAPVDNTLFFAGEATDTSGHTGTVHGAIASAHRAADEILKSVETNSG